MFRKNIKTRCIEIIMSNLIDRKNIVKSIKSGEKVFLSNESTWKIKKLRREQKLNRVLNESLYSKIKRLWLRLRKKFVKH
jgi:hypothetical protein